MSSEEDAILAPIEIRTEDLTQIKQLIDEIKEAENSLQRIKNQPRRKTTRAPRTQPGFTAVGTPVVETERQGGIFGGVPEVKGSFRDKTSAAPFQRQNEFKKLRDEVGALRNTSDTQSGAIDSLLGGAFLTGGMGQRLSAGAKVGGSVLTGGALFGGPLAMATRLLPFIGVGLIAFGFVTLVTEALLKPGGPFDRRFKRIIRDEIAPAFERREKQEINQGIRVIRITSSPGVRGPTQIITNLQNLRNGQPIFDQEFEALSKGVLLR